MERGCVGKQRLGSHGKEGKRWRKEFLWGLGTMRRLL